MNLLKSLALATFVVGLTVNVAMAETTTDTTTETSATPWCGYDPNAKHQADNNEDLADKGKQLKAAAKKCSGRDKKMLNKAGGACTRSGGIMGSPQHNKKHCNEYYGFIQSDQPESPVQPKNEF